MTQQQKEDEEEEDRGTTEMQTNDLTDIPSAIHMATEKLCDIDPEWVRSSTVQRGITAMLHLLQNPAKKKKKSTVETTFFLYVF